MTTYIGFVIERMQNGKYSDNGKLDGILKKIHHQQMITLYCIYKVIHGVTTYIGFLIERMQNTTPL